MGLSRQSRWKVCHLLALLSALGHDDGFTPVETVLRAGLIYPVLSADTPPITDFTDWFGRAGMLAAELFAHPAVSLRAVGEDLGLPDLGDPAPRR